MDYLELATRLGTDAAKVGSMSDLLGLRGRALRMFQRGLSDALYRDLQMAMDKALRARMLWTEIEQLDFPLMRPA